MEKGVESIVLYLTKVLGTITTFVEMEAIGETSCLFVFTIREHKYMTSEDFRGFDTIYHINHTTIIF